MERERWCWNTLERSRSSITAITPPIDPLCLPASGYSSRVWPYHTARDVVCDRALEGGSRRAQSCVSTLSDDPTCEHNLHRVVQEQDRHGRDVLL